MELQLGQMNGITRHVLFWLVIYLVWTYIKSNGGEHLGVYLVVNLFNLANYMVAYYTLKHFFIPYFFDRSRILLFIVSLVITSILLYLFIFFNDVMWAAEFGSWDPPKLDFLIYLQKTIQHYSPAMILLAWESHINTVNKQKRIQELTNEKLATELKFLKAQLNPHFLFNTLNNLYAQVITNSGRAPQMILQLSGILDYVLYKSQKQAVSLQEEVTIINDFLELEKIRYGDRLSVTFSVDGCLEVPISPLLLLSIVENAFKHGVRKGIEEAIVKINIEENAGIVKCSVWNTKSVFNDRPRDDHREGLGLSNIRGQLKISYPDSHVIEIKEGEGFYHLYVSIISMP